MTKVPHPYFPTDLNLLNYVENPNSSIISLTYFSILLLVCSSPFVYVLSTNSSKVSNKWNYLWFVNCFLIHTFFESYFVYNHNTLVSKTDLFANLWKEYSKADSRYLTSDACVLFIEAITAFILGPTCLYICKLMYTNNTRQHLPILLVSLAQLYGSALYYLTNVFQDFKFTRPEAYYVYFYFLFINSFWVTVPIYNIYNSYIVLYTNLKVEVKQE